MSSIAKHIDFVKSQAEFQRRMASKYSSEPKRAAKHLQSADGMESLLADLGGLQIKLAENPNLLNSQHGAEHPRLSLSWEEVEGLPPELLNELSVSESDKSEFAAHSLIIELGGVASLDRLLVALYRKSGEITKRQPLNQRLYRMVQKEMIYSVPGKKGVYSVVPMTEEDANKLI